MDPFVIVRGTGSIGERHLRVIQERVAARPVAYPVRPEQVERWRASGIEAVASAADLEPYLPCPAIVATDTGRHVTDAVELLRSGCDVLVEKPLSPGTAGAEELARVIRETGRRVFTAYCFRFDPGLLEFRRLLPQLGRLHYVRTLCQSYLPDWRPHRDYRTGFQARPGEGGVIRDLNHEVDYSLWLFGQPESVTAAIQNTGVLGIEVEEGADIIWRTADGASVTIRIDYLTRTTRRRLEAFGENGELQWDALAGTVTLTRAGVAPQVMKTGIERDLMLAAQTSAFLRASAGGDGGPLCTFEEARTAVRVTEAIYRAAENRREERVA